MLFASALTRRRHEAESDARDLKQRLTPRFTSTTTPTIHPQLARSVLLLVCSTSLVADRFPDSGLSSSPSLSPSRFPPLSPIAMPIPTSQPRTLYDKASSPSIFLPSIARTLPVSSFERPVTSVRVHQPDPVPPPPSLPSLPSFPPASSLLGPSSNDLINSYRYVSPLCLSSPTLFLV